MGIYAQHNGDTSIITIDKEQLLGIENIKFHSLVRDSIEAGSKDILVDLAKVKFITSLGVEGFLHARAICKDKNISFVLKNVNAAVMKILSTLRLTELFKFD